MSNHASKTCSVCDAQKPGAEFFRDRCSKDGLMSRCKACDKALKPTWNHSPRAVATRTCQFCSREFVTERRYPGLYCSRACRDQGAARTKAERARSGNVSDPFILDGALACRVRLQYGGSAIIDAEDAAAVGSWVWSLSAAGYAIGKAGNGAERRCVLMHRFLLSPPREMTIDHINRDRLDNRRANLRLATQSQNSQNQPAENPRNKTGLRGVVFDARKQRYRVDFTVEGRRHYIGLFRTLEQAREAVIDARARLMSHSPEALAGERI